jgi:hypothetical protein
MDANEYSYDYDPIGNRNRAVTNSVATDYEANGLNQYTNITGGVVSVPTYDLDGNMTFLPSSSLTSKFTYDGWNMIHEATTNSALSIHHSTPGALVCPALYRVLAAWEDSFRRPKLRLLGLRVTSHSQMRTGTL